MSKMSSSTESLPPQYGDESAGSSVSSRLQEEYDELLKYAIVMPTYDPSKYPKTLSDLRGSFPNGQGPTPNVQVTIHSDKDSETEISTIGDENGYEDENEGQQTPKQSTPRGIQIAYSSSLADNLLKTKPPPQPVRSYEVKTADLINLNSSIESSSKTDQDDMSEIAYTVTVDQDMTKMESVLDQWTYQLKKNVLAEFSQMKIKVIEQHRHQLQQEKERHAAEMNRMQNETESLKELLHTYEQSIERKDQVISNLTRAMQQQRDRFEMLKTFCEWKIRHNDAKRETFAGKLAMKHYEAGLQRKVWEAWHSIVETKWKSRVEKACQAKAQQVCMDLTNDYEAKMASLNEALESSRLEVERLHAERDRYEETMKKAFLRGVCALNTEAMAMFHQSDQNGDQHSEMGGEEVTLDHIQDQMTSGMFAHSVPQEEIYVSQPQAPPPPRVVTARPSQATAPSAVQSKPKVTAAAGKPKTVNAKITARAKSSQSHALGGSSSVGLGPPMSSVMVERHQPVTKSTIGHAVASRFPRQTQSAGQVVHSRIAGRAGQVPIVSPNIQTVKVVE